MIKLLFYFSAKTKRQLTDETIIEEDQRVKIKACSSKERRRGKRRTRRTRVHLLQKPPPKTRTHHHSRVAFHLSILTVRNTPVRSVRPHSGQLWPRWGGYMKCAPRLCYNCTMKDQTCGAGCEEKIPEEFKRAERDMVDGAR